MFLLLFWVFMAEDIYNHNYKLAKRPVRATTRLSIFLLAYSWPIWIVPVFLMEVGKKEPIKVKGSAM